MPLRHFLLALVVVTIWGLNFIALKIGLAEIPPILMCSLRFMFTSIPAIFFVPFPRHVKVYQVASYGIVMFALQFIFLFVGLHIGITPGMASLVMQTQLLFTILFVGFWLKEWPDFIQSLGALISLMGIALIGFHLDASVTLAGFVCILVAAGSWGMGNLLTKKTKTPDIIGLIVWGAFFAFPLVLMTSLIIEGRQSILVAYQQITLTGVWSLVYTVYLSTLVGYGLWNWLLSKYTVGTIVPFTLLVPIFGMVSSVWFFHEPLDGWKATSAILVMLGLTINMLSPYISQFLNTRLIKI